jgi:hypothetical protein
MIEKFPLYFLSKKQKNSTQRELKGIDLYSARFGILSGQETRNNAQETQELQEKAAGTRRPHPRNGLGYGDYKNKRNSAEETQRLQEKAAHGDARIPE